MMFNRARRDRVQSPCYGCGERDERCHGRCERYAAYLEAREAQYQASRAERYARCEIGHYKYETRTKQIRRSENARRR